MQSSLYDTLSGNWNINRNIEDRHSGQNGNFEGKASFEPQGGKLYYTENGTLTLGGAKLQASRSYQWMFDGPKVSVAYYNGDPFHDFIYDGVTARAAHLCGNDAYTAVYDFDLPDEWRVTWTVHGPRKNYTSRSVYSR